MCRLSSEREMIHAGRCCASLQLRHGNGRICHAHVDRRWYARSRRYLRRLQRSDSGGGGGGRGGGWRAAKKKGHHTPRDGGAKKGGNTLKCLRLNSVRSRERSPPREQVQKLQLPQR